MGRFSKNFLPIFFNVYSQQPPAGESATYRMAVLDTIKVYLTVTQTEVIPFFHILKNSGIYLHWKNIAWKEKSMSFVLRWCAHFCKKLLKNSAALTPMSSQGSAWTWRLMIYVDYSVRYQATYCLFQLLRLSMMDLVVAMAPLVDEATMTKTFELIRPHLEVRSLQHCLSLKVPCHAKFTLPR